MNDDDIVTEHEMQVFFGPLLEHLHFLLVITDPLVHRPDLWPLNIPLVGSDILLVVRLGVMGFFER